MNEILGHGAYMCLRPASDADVRPVAAAPIAALAKQLELGDEFSPAGPPPSEAIAFLRRWSATAGDIADDAVLEAEWVVHVASRSPAPVSTFCREAERLLKPYAVVRVLAGVIRPRSYSGGAMKDWAYARAVAQQPGAIMPNAFLIPMSKTAEWWRKDWMERHTYFLPRYDERGQMVAAGHALAAEAGIPCLLRRTYHALEVPAPPGAYDFITYFECADADVPVFEKVCANLRDVKQNPEWQFVREGPTWHGRRVPAWEALFSEARRGGLD